MNNYNLQVDPNPEVVELEAMVTTDNETLPSSDHELVDEPGDSYLRYCNFAKNLNQKMFWAKHKEHLVEEVMHIINGL